MAATNFDYYLMSDDFYRAFEERYYAPQDVIKQMRQQYLPFVLPLALLHPKSQTFDIGCGRGEWLEIMAESSLTPYGVDLDDGMLQACKEKGLPAQKGDAVEYLKTLKSESHLVVSAFHVVEHITFNELRTVVSEALRVLMPGGLLIMETPNPENITVATRNFYLDPTHQKPIPSQLLAFLPEYYGFSKVKVIRLQEDKSLVDKTWTSLSNVLSGVSPDYAVIAQKSGSNPLLACTNDAFSQEYGLTLDALVDKFDHQVIKTSECVIAVEAQVKQTNELIISADFLIKQAAEQASLAQAQANHANERATLAEAQAKDANNRATLAEAQARHANEQAALAEAQANHANKHVVDVVAELIAVRKSTSWRLTEPIRKIKIIFNSFKSRKVNTKNKIKLFLLHVRLYVNRRPLLRRAAFNVLSKFPTLAKRIRQVTLSAVPVNFPLAQTVMTSKHLMPHAHEIYGDLVAAIDENNKENKR